MGMAVDVGVKSLESNHDLHRSSAEILGDLSSSYLLLFYAVECGLKAALLRRTNGRSTAELDPAMRSHSLRDLAKELRLDGQLVAKLTRCARRDSGQVEPHELHEAWRYGAVLIGDHEKNAVAAIRELSAWIDQELGR